MDKKGFPNHKGWLAVGLLVIAGMVAALALNLKRGFDDELSNAATRSQNIAHAVAHQAAASLQQADLLLNHLLDDFMPAEGKAWFSTPDLADNLPKIRLTAPEIQSLRIIRADGHVFYTLLGGSAEVSGLFPGDEAFFTAHRDNPNLGLTLTGPSPGQTDVGGHLILSRRLDNPDGGFAGVAAAALSLSQIKDFFAAFNPGKNASLTLLDDKFAVLAHFPAGDAFRGKPLTGSQLEAHLRKGERGGTYTGASALDGVERINSALRAGDFPLYVEVGLVKRDVLEAWRGRALVEGAVVLVLCAAVLLLSIGTARRSRSAPGGEIKLLPAPAAGVSEILAPGEALHKPHSLAPTPAGADALAQQVTVLQLRLSEAQAKIENDRAQHLASIALLRKRADTTLSQSKESVTQQVADEVDRLVGQEREAMRRSRLAAMSEAIGNVAHLWRPPLNKLDLMLADIKVAQKFHELDPQRLLQLTLEGRQIVRDMLFTVDEFRNFFMPGKKPLAFNLENEVRDVVENLSPSLRENGIEIRVDAGEEVVAWGFPHEYAQVLLNVLGNARDALLANAVANGVIQAQVLREGEQSRVIVRDNAGGIADGILERIFEPDFATRRKGAGIGLFMSRIIMEDGMNGQIEARNIEGGSEFVISCPLAREL